MNFEGYKQALDSLEARQLEERSMLHREYAFRDGTRVEGEVIRDHIGEITIDTVDWYFKYDRTPSLIYIGVMMTKAKQPRKDGERRVVYEGNIL